jgi:glycerol transport system permease protein
MNKARPFSFSLTFYLIFLIVPVYWLINMSFQTTAEIRSSFSLLPLKPTLYNYQVIFNDSTWYMSYVNAIIYVSLNTLIALAVALPAAYAFSRYRFYGDRQMFFWFLVSRMIPPAILMVPFVHLFSELQLIDTYIAVAIAHCLFNVPVAIWILEGFISAIPRELDETAKIDGYSGIRYFSRIMLPQLAPGIGVTAFFCFMFSWIELLLSNALTTIDVKPVGAVMGRAGGLLGGMQIGLLSAASVLTLIPGVLLVFFVRRHLARGLSLGQVK